MAKENRSARWKLVKVSAVSAAGIALAAALASTALAAPTSIPKTAFGIKVIAAPGTENHITIIYGVFQQLDNGNQVDAQFITDTAGLAVSPGEGAVCTQPVGNTAACLDTTTLTGIPAGATSFGEDPVMSLGDLDDTLVSDNVGDLQVNGGPGNDTMMGGSRGVVGGSFGGVNLGNDPSSESFFGGSGKDVLKGFGQPDALSGGSGNDKLDGGPGNDTLDGGPGNDRCIGGPGHDVFRGCEHAKQ